MVDSCLIAPKVNFPPFIRGSWFSLSEICLWLSPKIWAFPRLFCYPRLIPPLSIHHEFSIPIPEILAVCIWVVAAMLRFLLSQIWPSSHHSRVDAFTHLALFTPLRGWCFHTFGPLHTSHHFMQACAEFFWSKKTQQVQKDDNITLTGCLASASETTHICAYICTYDSVILKTQQVQKDDNITQTCQTSTCTREHTATCKQLRFAKRLSMVFQHCSPAEKSLINRPPIVLQLAACMHVKTGGIPKTEPQWTRLNFHLRNFPLLGVHK